MYRNYSSSLRSLCSLAIVCCSALMPIHLYAQDDSGQPLITYNQSHPLLPENTEPMVQVFESGAVEVNRPLGNKHPGHYQIRIGAQQVARIRQLLENSSGVEGEVRSVNQQKMIASAISRSGQRTMTLESDPTTTVIAINQSSLASANPAAPTAYGEGMQVVSIDNLADMSDASGKPGLHSMRELELLLLGLYDGAGK